MFLLSDAATMTASLLSRDLAFSADDGVRPLSSDGDIDPQTQAKGV